MALRAAECDESPVRRALLYTTSVEAGEIGTALEQLRPLGSMIRGTGQSKINVAPPYLGGER